MGPPRGVWGLSESGKGKGYWKTLQPLTRAQSKIGEQGSNLGDQGADQGAQRGESGRGVVTGQSPGATELKTSSPQGRSQHPRMRYKKIPPLCYLYKEKKKIQQQTRTSNGRKQEGMKGRGAGQGGGNVV